MRTNTNHSSKDVSVRENDGFTYRYNSGPYVDSGMSVPYEIFVMETDRDTKVTAGYILQVVSVASAFMGMFITVVINTKVTGTGTEALLSASLFNPWLWGMLLIIIVAVGWTMASFKKSFRKVPVSYGFNKGRKYERLFQALVQRVEDSDGDAVKALGQLDTTLMFDVWEKSQHLNNSTVRIEVENALIAASKSPVNQSERINSSLASLYGEVNTTLFNQESLEYKTRHGLPQLSETMDSSSQVTLELLSEAKERVFEETVVHKETIESLYPQTD